MHNYRIITIISQSVASTLKLLQIISEAGVLGVNALHIAYHKGQ